MIGFSIQLDGDRPIYKNKDIMELGMLKMHWLIADYLKITADRNYDHVKIQQDSKNNE